MFKKLVSSIALMTVMFGVPGLNAQSKNDQKGEPKKEQTGDIYTDTLKVHKNFNTVAHVGVGGAYIQAEPKTPNKYFDNVKAGLLLKNFGTTGQPNVYINLSGEQDPGTSATQFTVLGVEATKNFGGEHQITVSPFVGYAAKNVSFGSTATAKINNTVSVAAGLRANTDFSESLYFAQGTFVVKAATEEVAPRLYTMGFSNQKQGESSTLRLFGEYQSDLTTNIPAIDKHKLIYTAGYYLQQQRSGNDGQASLGVSGSLLKQFGKFAAGPQVGYSTTKGVSVGVNARINLAKTQHR